MRYVVRPISDRTWLGSQGKEPTRFSAKWPATEALLLDEIAALRGRDVVLELDVRESDLKLNGELRANARPPAAAVAVAFESKHGPLIYRCDRFTTSWAHQGPEWWHNVRAIALTLQALRAVDRYGATATGQQYTGFKQLGAGRAMPASHLTADEALTQIVKIAYPNIGAESLHAERIHARASNEALAKLLRRAKGRAHPDQRAGDRALWDALEVAAQALGLGL